jgi:hypothetical protein
MLVNHVMSLILRASSVTTKISKKSSEECFAYLMFTIVMIFGAEIFTDQKFSALITLSSAFQCLGFSILMVQVVQERSIASISLRTLRMYVPVFVCRLYATCLYNGYLPMDRSGDYMYQLIEGVSLILVLWTIWKVRKLQQAEESADTCSVWVLSVGCVAFASLLRPSLNKALLPDAAWTFALYLETVAMIPQLYLLAKLGGEVESLQGHYIACTFASRLTLMRFWYTSYGELQTPGQEINWPGIGVMGSQLLQVVLLADFMYLYVTSVRLNQRLIVPTAI